MRKGQASIEAIIMLAAGLAVLSFSLTAIKAQATEVNEFLTREKGRAEMLECAMKVDAIASNGTELTRHGNSNCTAEKENRVKSKEWEGKSMKTIAVRLTSVNVNGKEHLEVQGLEHYK